jgi:biopolymer transport protein ExbB/TolQ
MLESFFADFGLEHVLVLFMLAISVLMLAITFERSARFAWVRVSVLRARKVIEAARAGDLASARAACETIQQPVRTVFVAGLDRALGTVKGDPARAMARETKRIGGTLKDRTWMLATSGALMPFVGLFGTVIGVMGSFQAIGESGQGGFAVVSVGLSQALIATAVGIAVALEAVFLFNVLQAFSTSLSRDLSMLVDELVELIEHHTQRGN